MLDYEIYSYEVFFWRKNGCSESSCRFDTEEEAVEFIKESLHKWRKYRLVKTQVAIIDFWKETP